MKTTALLAFVLLLTKPGLSQVTLTRLFQDLDSQDPKIRDAANRISVDTFINHIPTIESEGQALCSGLASDQEVARQDASGMLNTLAELYPAKTSVVSACTKQLITTASDPTYQIRANSLAALAMKADGPPADAAPVFEAALSDKDASIQQLGATGILKLPSSANTSGVNRLVSRLGSEQNPEIKRALLLGAVQARKTNPELAQAASRLIVDPDPGVQGAAIFAVEALNSEKSRALNELESYKTSQLLSPQVKPKLESTINRLQAATQ